MTENERRHDERVEALILVELDREGRHGVTRDASPHGFLIATRYRFAVGDRLDVVVHAPSATVHTTARVLRVEEAGPNEEWRYRLAVQVDATLPRGVLENGQEAAATLMRRTSTRPPG